MELVDVKCKNTSNYCVWWPGGPPGALVWCPKRKFAQHYGTCSRHFSQLTPPRPWIWTTLWYLLAYSSKIEQHYSVLGLYPELIFRTFRHPMERLSFETWFELVESRQIPPKTLYIWVGGAVKFAKNIYWRPCYCHRAPWAGRSLDINNRYDQQLNRKLWEYPR